MKILHVYKDFYPPVHGGMERQIGLMCRFQRQWADVQALMCSRSPWTRVIERDGTRVTEVGEWGRFQSAPISPLFPIYMRTMKTDIMVVHVPNPTAEMGFLLARPRCRLVVRYHSDVVRQAAAMKVYGPIQMNFLRKADIILPTSQRYVDTSATLQAAGKPCRVLPCGILPEEFEHPETERVAELRAKYGGAYVLFAGRHRYYKGLEYLVRAAKAIRARVVIAGDGPERPRCEALAVELGAPIVFAGTLSHQDLVNHLHGCELLVFPSVERSEAFGMSILEAHACGKPVVATTLGTGVEYANLDQKTGLNVPPRNADALAEAVNVLLYNAGLRRRMGEFARQRVYAEFHAERIAREEFSLYEELFGR
ncbi:MAG: glycosyltransferase [Candidatus Hydrogenedentes bacterium]|nr:glycosyltransferase [Candidatus Hydrogenedentota bacterium]